jgi:hypothetical protein
MGETIKLFLAEEGFKITSDLEATMELIEALEVEHLGVTYEKDHTHFRGLF